MEKKIDFKKRANMLVGFSVMVLGIMAAIPADLLAVTTPAAGSFAYDLYDIAVLKILQGPIGFVGGCGCIVFGAMSAMQHPLSAITPILGGAALLKADAIVNTLGVIF